MRVSISLLGMVLAIASVAWGQARSLADLQAMVAGLGIGGRVSGAAMALRSGAWGIRTILPSRMLSSLHGG